MALARALFLDEAIPLLTLTGPGGVGKTRLAQTIAHDLADHFADGFIWVELAPVSDPALVVPAIVHTLGLRESSEHSLEAQLIDFLRQRELLLVLDNFEHLLDAAPQLNRLLAHCPRLTILVTSRSVLHLSAEHDLPVPPLTLPLTSKDVSGDEVASSEAVRLFVAHARRARPDFGLTDSNAAAVATICRRLDGLPLAIQLAASRIAHFPLPTLLQRLEHRLPLLTGGARDVPARLRTMRDAIAWSHDLLSPDGQFLFRRLAVFVGEFTLEAAEEIVGPMGDGTDAIAEGIAALVDESMIQMTEGPGGEPRYRMLETIREFGLERLVRSGEDDEWGRRHADYYAALAERLGLAVTGPTQRLALARLDADGANLRAAMEWAIKQGDRALAVRFPGALLSYWFTRGRFREGAAWAEKALELSGDAPLDHVIKAIDTAANLHALAGEYERAAEWAATLFDLARREGDATGEALGLFQLSFIAHHRRDFAAAIELSEAALAQFRALESERWLPWAATRAGLERLGRGEYSRAATLFDEAADLFRAAGHDAGVALTLCNQALAQHGLGDVDGADRFLREALELEIALERPWQFVDIFLGLADVALVRRQPRRVARLLGAVDALGEAIGYPRVGWARDAYDRMAGRAREVLGDDAFDRLWRRGRQLTVSEAAAEALAVSDGMPASGHGDEAEATETGLTAREREVLRLLAEGRSDRQIAAALSISPKTVGNHVSSILAKLEVETRTAAATQALRRGLADAAHPPPIL